MPIERRHHITVAKRPNIIMPAAADTVVGDNDVLEISVIDRNDRLCPVDLTGAEPILVFTDSASESRRGVNDVTVIDAAKGLCEYTVATGEIGAGQVAAELSIVDGLTDERVTCEAFAVRAKTAALDGAAAGQMELPAWGELIEATDRANTAAAGAENAAQHVHDALDGTAQQVADSLAEIQDIRDHVDEQKDLADSAAQSAGEDAEAADASAQEAGEHEQGALAHKTDAGLSAQAAAASAQAIVEIAPALQLAENARVEAEQGRASAEDMRVGAETERVTAEGLRVSAESERISAESGRASAESGRISAESGRVIAEQSRANTETQRQTQETDRQANTATAVANANAAAALASSYEERGANWRKVTGNPIQIYPVPGSPLHTRVQLTATQSGGGDPSTANYRPIVPSLLAGQRAVVKRTGKNLLQNVAVTSTLNGITMTVNADKSVTLNGTASAVANFRLLGGFNDTIPILRFRAGYTYTLNKGTPGGVSLSAYSRQSGEWLNMWTAGNLVASASKTFTADEYATDILISIPSGSVLSVTIYPMLELGPTATAYEPYIAADYSFIAQADKYGLPGAAAWVGNEDEGDGTALISYNSTTNVGGIVDLGTVIRATNEHNIPGVANDPQAICTSFVRNISYSADTPHFYNSLRQVFMFIPKALLSSYDATGIRAWWESERIAGRPVQILIQRAAPTTITGASVSIGSLPQTDRYTPRLNVAITDVGVLEVGYAEHPSKDYDYLTEKTGYGVISGLAVAAQSTPNMTVGVASGLAYLPSGQRITPVAVVAQTINAADSTNPRIDLIYVSSAGVTTYLAGMAAASLTAPTLPTGALLLAEIAVPAGVTTITNAMITARKKGLWAEDYITATLLNGVTGYIRYSKDISGRVTVRLSITPGSTLVTGTLLANLASGYRIGLIFGFALRNGSSGAMTNFYTGQTGNILNFDALTAGVTYTGTVSFLADA